MNTNTIYVTAKGHAALFLLFQMQLAIDPRPTHYDFPFSPLKKKSSYVYRGLLFYVPALKD